MNDKKSQAEIFGVALMFVVIILGILIYGRIQALKSLNDDDNAQESEYKILAEGTLNSMIKMSTGCYVERNRDTLKDLINYCLDNEFAGNDIEITCNDNTHIGACAKSKQIIEHSLNTLYSNSENSIINAPFKLTISMPQNKDAIFNNVTISNFGSFKYNNVIITEDNRRSYKFKRAPSGLISWATSQREINFELYIYYR